MVCDYGKHITSTYIVPAVVVTNGADTCLPEAWLRLHYPTLLKKQQDMLTLQQGRLHNQHLHILALEKQLKRQERKLSQSHQHLLTAP